ncbi:hypothetical protein ACAG96_03600 [Candidatus Izemoplasma sp. B36]|uniref:hypothetical protein n=1 Tax=Candidatus Izemoplasma sp. B36 TaxID=3242468 RepID=UPI0035561E9B
MNLSELGFDFSNLQTCTIKKKNHLFPLITTIIGLSFLPIFIVFLVLFLLQVNIEMNNIPTTYGDPEYMKFFSIFLPVMGGISLIFIILSIYGLTMKPKLYMVVDKDKTNFDTFYYIYNSFRKEYIYLTENFVLIYNERYKNLREETSYREISKIKNKFIFWKEFSDLKNYVVKRKRNKTILKYKSDYRYQKSYHFSNDIHIVPNKIKEYISTYGVSKGNIQGFSTYYFEAVNRRQIVDIHPEIKRKIASFI